MSWPNVLLLWLYDQQQHPTLRPISRRSEDLISPPEAPPRSAAFFAPACYRRVVTGVKNLEIPATSFAGRPRSRRSEDLISPPEAPPRSAAFFAPACYRRVVTGVKNLEIPATSFAGRPSIPPSLGKK